MKDHERDGKFPVSFRTAHNWKFPKPDPAAPTAEKKERGGMFLILIFGIILLTGGLIFAWKINAFNLS